MDNIELARMYGVDEFNIFSHHDAVCDDFNDLAIADTLRYGCASNIINRTRDSANIRQMETRPPIKLTHIPETTTGIEGYPYVKVDFKWRSGSKDLDPNDMDNKHLENSIKYAKRLMDSGDMSDIEGERIIRGFKKILEARANFEPAIIESETLKLVKGMETPLISVVDKSTGEVVDLDNIPYAVILDMVKKYSK